MGIDCSTQGGVAQTADRGAGSAQRARSADAADAQEGGFSALMGLLGVAPTGDEAAAAPGKDEKSAAPANNEAGPAAAADLLAQAVQLMPPMAPQPPAAGGEVAKAGGGWGALPQAIGPAAAPTQDMAAGAAVDTAVADEAAGGEAMHAMRTLAEMRDARAGEGPGQRAAGDAPDEVSWREAGLAADLSAPARDEEALMLPGATSGQEHGPARHVMGDAGWGPHAVSGGGEHGLHRSADGGGLAPQAEPAQERGALLHRQVSEQVSYWLGRHVQNAELRLDGPGQSAVEVSIALQGKEAHVEFRCNQLETRQVLEGAMAQLRDLLQGEGLVLAGVSVGTSGTGQGFAEGRRPAARPRSAAVALPVAADAGRAGQPVRLAPGRRLDLYV